MWRLLMPLMLLAAVPAVLSQERLLGYLPRPGLRATSMSGLQETLELMTESLQEVPLRGGGVAVVSPLAVPTLHAKDSLCQTQSKIYWDQILAGSDALWAWTMFDATGKLPDGILVGNLAAFGSWEECLSVEVHLNASQYPKLPEEARHFLGRYVPVTAGPVVPPTQDDAQVEADDDGLGEVVFIPSAAACTIGFCVPSSCSSEDVREGVQKNLGDKVVVTAGQSKAVSDTTELTSKDKGVISLLAIIGALLVAGTVLDLYYRQMAKLKNVPAVKPSQLPTSQQALLAFSLYTNTVKLLDTNPGKGMLTCLHGIRFISMSWVLLGHAFSFFFMFDSNPSAMFLEWPLNPLFEAVLNATPSVDTFFLLSGVVLAYTFCATYEKTKSFNLFSFYLYRYLRLTPPLAIAMAIAGTWYTYLGDGPLWQISIYQGKLCEDTWWRNLLYIQNFFKIEDVCLGQSWYLAADMQMYLFLGPAVLLPLVWRPLLGLLWLALLTAGFLALRIATWSVKDFPPTLLAFKPDEHSTDMMDHGYALPWIRCTVWLTGIGLGYLLHRLRGKQVTLQWWLWLAGWVLAIGTGLSVVYGMTNYQMSYQTYTKAVAVAYGGLHRFAWGLAVSWVIFACVTGYGGFINTFLSYPGFIPLSRLTYCTYLVHLNVLMFVDTSVKGTLYFDVMRVTYRVLAHLMVSVAVAVPFSLAFEAPFMGLTKLMFAPARPRAQGGEKAVHEGKR